MNFRRLLPFLGGGASGCRRASPRRHLAGIALTEVLVGMGIITLTAATSMWALGAANRLAAVNRNYTSAKMLAQNRAGEVLSTGYTTTSVPAVLATGTTSTAVTVNPGPPAINGTMTTVVSVVDPALNIRQVRITVAYSYNGRLYSYSMATARSPD